MAEAAGGILVGADQEVRDDEAISWCGKLTCVHLCSSCDASAQPTPRPRQPRGCLRRRRCVPDRSVPPLVAEPARSGALVDEVRSYAVQAGAIAETPDSPVPAVLDSCSLWSREQSRQRSGDTPANRAEPFTGKLRRAWASV